HFLAGFQFVALRHAVLLQDVDVVVDDDARADTLGVLGVVPEPVFGDVAVAADLDRQGGLAVAGHGDGDAVLRAVQRRRVDVLHEAVTAPEFLAGPRFHAFELEGRAVQELVAAVDLDEDRRAPGAGLLVLFPDRFPGLLVDGDQVIAALALVGAAPEDAQVAVQHRRGGVTEIVLPLAQVVALPKFLAPVVVAEHAGGPEADDDALAVGGRRGVGVPVLGPVALLVGVVDVVLPEFLAVGAVEADQAADGAALVGDGE